MTEKYFEAEMDVVEFLDVDVISTSDIAATYSPVDGTYIGPAGDTFLE